MRRSILIIAAALAGCASTGPAYRPIIDTAGIDRGRYERDLQECQTFAQQAAGAADGAVAGAILGGLVGAFLVPRGYRNYSAGRVGGVGALAGATEAQGVQRDIIRRCLAGRGYKVLQ